MLSKLKAPFSKPGLTCSGHPVYSPDLSADNFAVSDGHYFRIAEPFAGGVLPFVGDEYLLSLAHEVYELKAGNRLVVFPAPIESFAAISTPTQ